MESTQERKKMTLADLRQAARSGQKVAMLTCYDYTTARLMDEANVPAILVGDSAGNVILGYDSTLPVELNFLITITAAVRRGAPRALLVADMPFGSYQSSTAKGVENACRMVKQTQCDCIKLEVAAGHLKLVRRLAEGGMAVMAHLGLRPQTVGLMGGYKFQGRTAAEAMEIVSLAQQMEEAGAAALLLEAVPPQVSEAVVEATRIPVIGCGAGSACHGSVVVTHDAIGLTPRIPRFVPQVANIGDPLRGAFAEYVRRIMQKEYPADEHQYVMPSQEQEKFGRMRSGRGAAGGVLDPQR